MPTYEKLELTKRTQFIAHTVHHSFLLDPFELAIRPQRCLSGHGDGFENLTVKKIGLSFIAEVIKHPNVT